MSITPHAASPLPCLATECRERPRAPVRRESECWHCAAPVHPVELDERGMCSSCRDDVYGSDE